MTRGVQKQIDQYPHRVAGLTPAQQRYLDEITEAGTKTYNDRARKSLETLQSAGLIEVEREYIPQARGSGFELVVHHHCKPKG